MKRTITLLMSLATLVIIPACQKVAPVQDNPAAKKQVTVTASIPADGITTRVALTQDETNKKTIKLSWENDDVITINGEPFAIDPTTISSNGKTAQFTGNDPGSGPYTIAYSALPGGFAEQTQSADGNTDHLGYGASLAGVTDYEVFSFDSEWAAANGATLKQSSVLRLRALLPADVASNVQKVIFKASDNVFAGGNTLTVTLTVPGTEGTDNELDVYATLPAGDVTLSEDMDLLIQFQVSDAAYDKYTAYRKVASGTHFVVSGQSQYLGIKCTNIEQYAGTNDAGTEDNPYLIGDRHQLAAVHDLASTTSKTYFKMIDDVDMTDMTSYVPINDGVTGYTQVVDFDGNDKTVSHLGKHLFYVLKGDVYDLILEDCSVNSRGILAEYIQGTGHTVTNVNVNDGTVNYTGSYDNTKGIGGLIGTINNGSGTVVTITDCKVRNTNVTAKGLVGGVIGYANSIINMSGCEYSGGTVTASNNRWCGGMLGSTGDFASTIADCQVMNATVTSSSDRVGGFTGQIGRNGVTVKGCTVGTESQKVTVHSSLSGATVNLGGFAGVCYGIVTKNGEVRNKAFVNITCDNSNAGTSVNIGGFVGYLEKCSIDYSDANATISSIRGHQVGGFAAFLTNAGTCTIDNCTASGTVTGNNFVAGFIGQANAADHVITNNTSAGSVSGAATVAGFVGMASQGTWTKNSTSCTVSASGANSGGFAGQLNGNVTVSKCFTTGTVTGSGNVCGGFTAIASNGATINDCYSTSDLGGGTRKRGGLVGYVDAGTVSINRCYTTSNISNNFEMGGLIGFVSVETLTMTKCAAWNGTLVASSRADNNWSSAACVGVTYPSCTLTDNYRSPDMDLLAYWGTNSGCSINLPNSFQHPNVSPSTPLTDPSGNAVTSSTMRPYQGKCEEGKTLSQLASTTLGWSGDVWDFTGDLPVLK